MLKLVRVVKHAKCSADHLLFLGPDPVGVGVGVYIFFYFRALSSEPVDRY